LTLLMLDGVACRRGGRLLFEGLSLTLAPGEAAVATGPNGVGKSSLLRLVAGLLEPASGTVAAQSVALADENLALDSKLSLGRALAFWAALDAPGTMAPSEPATAHDLIPGGLFGPQRAMDAMGLAALSSVPVRMLSTGQRKRAVLARVIASGASLWLLDEPANGLDTDGLERLTAAMAAHRAAGGAILAASHQLLCLAAAKTVTLA
jgi:heme exporter protein A